MTAKTKTKKPAKLPVPPIPAKIIKAASVAKRIAWANQGATPSPAEATRRKVMKVKGKMAVIPPLVETNKPLAEMTEASRYAMSAKKIEQAKTAVADLTKIAENGLPEFLVRKSGQKGTPMPSAPVSHETASTTIPTPAGEGSKAALRAEAAKAVAENGDKVTKIAPRTSGLHAKPIAGRSKPAQDKPNGKAEPKPAATKKSTMAKSGAPGVGAVARAAILAGKSNQEALDAVMKAHPGCSSNLGCMGWYRNQMRKKGLLQAADRDRTGSKT